MNFSTIAQAFEVIDKTSSRTAITEHLAELLEQATPQQAKEICYLSLGVLNPPHVGTQFNLAQKSMVKIVADLLAKKETEIQHLLGQKGDLGTVVEECLSETYEPITVEELYKKLEVLEKIEGTGSQELKATLVKDLLINLDPISAKYVVRIILGTLRLGFSDMTLVDALSWMQTGDKSVRKIIEQAYNVCADIGYIAFSLKEKGIDAIAQMTMQVGVPVRPAAADRLPDVEAIINKLGPCVAQPKLDGFRLQVHIDKTSDTPRIKFFSRNLTDMSNMFPEFVRACSNLPVQTLIADGEAMVFDPNTKQFASFQETVKRRRKHGIEQIASELPLQLYLFDVLQCDGKSLLDVGHNERRDVLQRLTSTNSDQTLQCIDERYIETAKSLEDYFIETIAGGLEGLVIKKIDASYQPGKRSANWIKLKYQAAEKLQDSLDVVILGYYAGKGKRARFGIGAFLVGIYNPRDELYETVAKIGTGLSDEQWVDFKKRCDVLRVSAQPKNIVCDKNLAPDVWVDPSLVCEVLADEVTFSPIHTAGKTNDRLGFALRFPRFLKYRDDKSSHQATTLAELETFHNR